MAASTVSSSTSGTHPRGGPPQRHLRTDRWWVEPALTATVLFLFVVYSTWRAFENAHYSTVAQHRNYISPFYSPCVAKSCPADVRWFSINIAHWFSPALYILIFPLGFRLTCYYYRKAYYRAFWLSPPACAVSEPHKSYSGETRFPLIMQNVHRLFLYAATIFNVILTFDAFYAFFGFDGRSFGMGLGTLVLLANATLLWLYTLSCHSCRHLIGGRINHFSKHPVRYKAWTFVSRLNAHHMRYAWLSLVGVAAADFYVRLIATGAFHDPRFF
ncbi:MAG: hypothetical protein QOJ11_2708 [Frankiales bacterium]|jgi:hypothetical protein|nr:hypothetical protein [Frankiales bacterium]